MKTFTVTIGRNADGAGDGPLNPDAWNQFVYDTRRAVEAVTRELWVAAAYRGSWEGRSEDAYVFHGPAVDSPAADDALRHRLSVLAGYYGQQAIGVAIGVGELVEAVPTLIPEGVTA